MSLALPATSIDKRLYAPWKVATAMDVLAAQGIEAEAVLAGTGLTAAAVRDAATRISVRQFIRVCGNAIGLARDRTLAFRIGEQMRVSSYGMYGYALMCAPTLREVYDAAVRFHMLATPVIKIEWETTGESLAWVMPDPAQLDDIALTPVLARFLVEMQAAIHVTLHKDVMGPDCVPSLVRVMGAPPPHARAYETYLQCPVEFGHVRNEMHYPLLWLERAPRLANPITAATLLQTCATLLAEIERAVGVAGQVYRALVARPGHFPDIESVAEQLHMTSRTLRRKLEAEGTSYNQLLNDVRRSLAMDYLRSTELTTEDIAVALGFSESASFRNAFRRWTSTSPTEFRQRAAAGVH
jgi:AraC-like DNA-binding protein